MAVTLPDTASVGDAGHTSDHNLIVAAVTNLQSYLLALQGTATTARESMPRIGSGNLTLSASGNMHAIAVPVLPGDVITNVTFVSATTALTMGSNNDGNLWFALYDGAGGLLRQTANQGGSATWTASTAKTLALTSTYAVPASTFYLYAAIMVNYGTGGSPALPTIRGVAAAINSPLSAGAITGQVRVSGRHSTGSLTTTAPATITWTNEGSLYYAYLS